MVVAILIVLMLLVFMIYIGYVIYKQAMMEVDYHVHRQYMNRPSRQAHMSKEEWEEAHYGRTFPDKFININGEIIEVKDDE